MAHAIIRSKRGRQNEADFETTEITVDIFFGEHAVEAPQHPTPSDKRRFALLNLPRELFNRALEDAARCAKEQRPAVFAEQG